MEKANMEKEHTTNQNMYVSNSDVYISGLKDWSDRIDSQRNFWRVEKHKLHKNDTRRDDIEKIISAKTELIDRIETAIEKQEKKKEVSKSELSRR